MLAFLQSLLVQLLGVIVKEVVASFRGPTVEEVIDAKTALTGFEAAPDADLVAAFERATQ